jgi:hypothetical protein
MQISKESIYLGFQPVQLFAGPRPESVTPVWEFAGVLRSASRASVTEIAMFGIAFLVLAGLLATEVVDRRLFTRGVLLVTTAFFISLLPVLPAPDIQVVSDQYFLLLTALGSWIVLALCLGMRGFIRLRGRGQGSYPGSISSRAGEFNLP